MKKIISTIVAVALITSMSVSTASAGNRDGVDPIWIPVAILSTFAAVALSQPAVVHEQRVTYAPRPHNRVVVYQAPQHEHRHYRHYERDRRCETDRYRD